MANLHFWGRKYPSEHIQCVFLNDVEKNTIHTMIKTMHKPFNTINGITTLGEVKDNNILVIMNSKQGNISGKMDYMDKTCSKEIIDNVLQKQENIMDDVLKVAILLYKFKYFHDLLNNVQFKEAILPILYLRICFSNINVNLLNLMSWNNCRKSDTIVHFWKGNPLRDKYINVTVNNEILITYINLLKIINNSVIDLLKCNNKKCNCNKQDIINYSNTLYFKSYINTINEKVLESQKYIPKKLPLYLHNYEINNSICLPEFIVRTEVTRLSQNISRTKTKIRYKLHRKLKKVVTIEEMLRQIISNDGRIPHNMYLNERYLKYLVESKSINFITLKLQKIKSKALKECKSLNMQLKYIKKIECNVFKYENELSCVSDVTINTDTKDMQQNDIKGNHKNSFNTTTKKCNLSDSILYIHTNNNVTNTGEVQNKIPNMLHKHTSTSTSDLDAIIMKQNTTSESNTKSTLLVQNENDTLCNTVEYSVNKSSSNPREENTFTNCSETVEADITVLFKNVSNHLSPSLIKNKQDTECLVQDNNKDLYKKRTSKLPKRIINNINKGTHKKSDEYFPSQKNSSINKNISKENAVDLKDAINDTEEHLEFKEVLKRKMYVLDTENLKQRLDCTCIFNDIKTKFNDDYDVALLEYKNNKYDKIMGRKSSIQFNKKTLRQIQQINMVRESSLQEILYKSKIPVPLSNFEIQNPLMDKIENKLFKYDVKEVSSNNKVVKFVCIVEQ